jgi:uncharacterized protein (TIGR03083 family)
MTKDELLAAIRRDRAAFQALVAPLSDAQLTDPTLAEGWSIKDVVAHIAAWEGRCAGWLEAAARGETAERPEVKDVDGSNARDFAAARQLSLADVLARSRAAHTAMLRAVEALSEADMRDETRFGWPTWQMASSNSDEHYREHTDQIRAWLAHGGRQ